MQIDNVTEPVMSDGPSENPNTDDTSGDQNSRDLYTRRVQLLDAWNRINLDEVSDIGTSDTSSNVSGATSPSIDSDVPEDDVPNVPNGPNVFTATSLSPLAEATSCPTYIINPDRPDQIHVPDIRWNRNRHRRGVTDYNRLMNDFDAAVDEE